jgi:protein O-GlcNAc transferase
MKKKYNEEKNDVYHAYQTGNFNLALKNAARLLESKSRDFDMLHLIGVIYGQKKEYAKSINYLEKALKIRPANEFCHFNYANSLTEMGDLHDAIKHYKIALQINPKYKNALLNYGNVLTNLDRHLNAIECYKKLIEIDCHCIDAWANQAKSLIALNQYNHARSLLIKGIEVNKRSEVLYSALGYMSREIGDIEDAIKYYQIAVEINPNAIAIQTALLFTYHYLPNYDKRFLYQQSVQLGRYISQGSRFKYTHKKFNRDTKIRIGFVSADLTLHPVGQFVIGLLELISRDLCEIYIYSNNKTEDSLTKKIHALSLSWRNIHDVSDSDAAEIINKDGIHILIDLSGYTAGQRLGVFAYKPAAIQISWLGYFATTGLPEMDYFIGDARICPESEDSYFSEKILRLPDIWLSRKDPEYGTGGLEPSVSRNGFITFGSFVNYAKINTQVIRAWALILNEVPDSKLLIKTRHLSDVELVKKLEIAFNNFSVTKDRLIFESMEDLENYYQAYNKIDIILDTFPYPGGTTTFDAFWMGVPVIVLKGDSYLSRFGESICFALKRQDLLAHDVDDYIAKAKNISSDVDRLKMIRNELYFYAKSSPLFDINQFTKSFELMLERIFFEKCESV